ACNSDEEPAETVVPLLSGEQYAVTPPETADCKRTIVQAGGVATEIRGLFLAGDLLYVGDDYGGFRILDVSDPANPVQVGALPLLAGVSRGVHGTDGLAWLTAADAGLIVIDVSVPSMPEVVATLDLPGYTRHAWIEGNLAAIADDFEGFRMADVSDPTAPKEIGSFFDARPAFRTQIVGQVAYVACGPAGLFVMDISDPTNPTPLAIHETPGHAWDIQVVGTTAYVADDVEGLRILDVSNPVAPKLLSTLDTPGHCRSLYVVGDRLYVADGTAGLAPVPPDPGGYLGDDADGHDGLQVIDVSDPSNPRVVSTADTAGYALVVTADETRAFVGSNGAGLRLLEATPTPKEVAGFTQLPGTARDLAFAGDHVLVATRQAGLRIVDTRQSAVAMEQGATPLPGEGFAVAAQDGHAWVASGTAGITTVRIPRFETPAHVHTLPLPGDVHDVALAMGALWAATSEATVSLSIATPGAPTVSSTTAEPARALAGDATQLVVASDTQIRWIRDGVEPRTWANTGAEFVDIAVSGETAAIAAMDGGAWLISYSESQPTGTATPPGPTTGVALTSDHLYVIVGDPLHVASAIHVYGLEDLSTPQMSVDLFEPGTSVHLSGSRAFLTASDGGLRLMELGCAE
ncbi:MAG: hypothetical protein ACI9OJ_002908, partial [Myxococcota bacterium]